jgi:Ca2+-binding EF-hand superfamily protein
MSSAISGLGANWAAQAMTGASMRSSPAQKMSNVFSQIDTGNTGSISKAQFTQAFNALNPPSSFKAMGADAVFAKLDVNKTGSVTKQEFVSGMTQMMSDVRQQKHQAYAQQAATTPAQTIDASLSGMSQLTIGSHINVKA